MKQMGVVGAGTMGAGIAQTLVQHGYHTMLMDQTQSLAQKGVDYIAKRLARSVSKGRMSEIERTQALALLHPVTSLQDLQSCEVVIEAASENMQIKKTIFRELDQVCQADAVLATNTSSLSITELACSTLHPDRVIGMHFFNPVPVMKLVEVIEGIATSEMVRETVMALAKKLHKQPVLVQEAPGFVVNRLLIPMINEAVGVFADGVASAEDIDTAMKLGANHPIGPLALADLIGNDVCLAIMDVLHQEFGEDKYRAHPLLRKMVRGGLLGRKSGKGFYSY